MRLARSWELEFSTCLFSVLLFAKSERIAAAVQEQAKKVRTDLGPAVFVDSEGKYYY